jgi:hypothetical protein
MWWFEEGLDIFFLEHAGELCIIVLVEEKESYIDPNTHTHTSRYELVNAPKP